MHRHYLICNFFHLGLLIGSSWREHGPLGALGLAFHSTLHLTATINTANMPVCYQ
jgi:hypothetical protein